MYRKEEEFSEENSTATFSGIGNIGFNTVTGSPSTWYTEVNDNTSKRLEDPSWKVFTANYESNYPSSWDEEETESSQSCGLWR